MLLQQSIQIHIAYSVAIGKTERLVTDIFFHALDPPAGLGMQPSVNQCNPPGLGHIAVDNHLVFRGKIKCHIGAVEVIICEIFFDDIALISTADYKVLKPKHGVVLHDMPQNRLVPNSNHGLGFQMALLTDTGTQSACQNHNFHEEPSFYWGSPPKTGASTPSIK